MKFFERFSGKKIAAGLAVGASIVGGTAKAENPENIFSKKDTTVAGAVKPDNGEKIPKDTTLEHEQKKPAVEEQEPEEDQPAEPAPSAKAVAAQLKGEEPVRIRLPLLTSIRHWSTPDYTRIAIDLEDEVKYEVGRVGDPDRIFFDLHDTKLASELVGKSFDVGDGFLRKIRVAQYTLTVKRISTSL